MELMSGIRNRTLTIGVDTSVHKADISMMKLLTGSLLEGYANHRDELERNYHFTMYRVTLLGRGAGESTVNDPNIKKNVKKCSKEISHSRLCVANTKNLPLRNQLEAESDGHPVRMNGGKMVWQCNILNRASAAGTSMSSC